MVTKLHGILCQAHLQCRVLFEWLPTKKNKKNIAMAKQEETLSLSQFEIFIRAKAP